MSQQNPSEQFPSVMTPGMVANQQFGSQSIQRTGEVAQASMSAHVQASVQAKYIMAERRPRDEEMVRTRLLRDCQRPHFAAHAIYRVPRGGSTITGLNIRFAEAAVRAMGNIWCESFVIHEDTQKRITRIRVVDLENNTTHERDITVEKIVERSRPGPRGHVGQRVNSQGQTVFLVRSTEEELGIKEAALSSKALRTLMLRLIPGWLQEECKDAILATQRQADAVDPDAAKRKIIDAFADVRVMPDELVRFLGHPVDQCNEQEICDLRGILAAIRDGEAHWPDILAARSADKTDEAKGATGKRSDEVLGKLAGGRRAKGDV